MIDYVIYGKVIIDEIASGQGKARHELLGGGGPQAAFGARLWSESVGLLTRSGDDLGDKHIATLSQLRVNLDGWNRFPDLPTPHSRMTYDENEYLVGSGITHNRDEWFELLDRRLELPEAYRKPRSIHLITEFPDEPMVETALGLRDAGTAFSLEPLPFKPGGPVGDRMVLLFKRVDIATPDWPTASGLAGSDDPVRVMCHWSSLGPQAIAIRHGARGSYVWSRDHDRAWHIPPVPTDLVDPTGAGNAYGGGLCVGWGESGDVRLAGSYGAVSAAFLVRTLGIPKLTDELLDEASQLLERTYESARRL